MAIEGRLRSDAGQPRGALACPGRRGLRTDRTRFMQGFQRHRAGVMAKPVCLITGATEGVGKATAQALARKGFTVVLAARSLAKAESVKREIAATSGAKDIDIIVGDLNSLSQAR